MVLRLRTSVRAFSAVALIAVGMILATVWTAGSIAGSHHVARTDTRLLAVIMRGQAVVAERVAAANRRASTVGGSTAVQTALSHGDLAVLAAIARRQTDVAFVVPGRPIAGHLPEASIRGAVDVFSAGKRIGRIVSATPLDTLFLRDVRSVSGLAPGDLLVLVRRGVIVVGPHAGAKLELHNAGAVTVRVADLRYRAVPENLPVEGAPIQLVALGPYHGSPVSLTVLGESLLLSLVLLVGAAALFGAKRPRRRTERRQYAAPPPIATVRDAIALVGNTLAATHNPEALLPVILTAAIEATGAAGGELLKLDLVVASSGNVVEGASELALDLSDETGRPMQLRLWSGPAGFSEQARDAARWFVEQAAIALDNARLHRIVQVQAITDDLTGLANRRSFVARLAIETSRAERFGSPLVLVLADLDDFKQINDRYGHRVGDIVLEEVARILRGSVREIDLPVRLGGEEFAALLPETDLSGGLQLAESLRARLADARIDSNSGEAVRITASFGVAAHAKGVSAEDMLAEADTCLYQAKRQGKNIVVSRALHGSASTG